MKARDGLTERLCALARALAGGGPAVRRAAADAAAALMRCAGADRCIVARLAPDGHIRDAEGWTIEGARVRAAAEAASHFLIRRVVQTRAPVRVDDARRDRRWRSQRAVQTRKAERALLGLPAFRGDAVAAVVCLSHDAVPLRCDEDDPAPLLCAQMLGLALAPAARAAESAPRRAEALPAAASAGALAEPYLWQGFVTRSPALRDVLSEAARIAPVDLPVLIVGEDGTGKDLLARAMHAASGLRGPFVAASLGAIPETLAEVELFGCEPGAYTGATAARRGLVAEAEEGTLFLDDLQEAPRSLQAALLRVLAEGVVRPLGGAVPRAVDFRLIAASTLGFSALCAEHIVREDLLYRINGAVLALPPLRARREDVPLLFRRFLEEAGRGACPAVAPEAEAALIMHAWPGNVRELRNEARRVRALGRDTVVAEDFAWVREAGPARAPASRLREAVREAERAHVLRALDLALGNKSRAAAMLGITRRSLYRRLDRYAARAPEGPAAE